MISLLCLATVLGTVFSLRAPYRPCPSGWTEDGFGNVCYQSFEPGNMTFAASRTFCQNQDEDADLAVIRSQSDVDVISSLTRANTWVLAQKDGIGQSYDWINEPNNRFFPWGANQPNDPSAVSCAYFYREGEFMADFPCDVQFPNTVCELRTSSTLSPTPCGCPPGYDMSESNEFWCFRPSLQNQVNFTVAEMICETEGFAGSALASLRGEADRVQVSGYVVADLWLGIKFTTENDWSWLDTTVDYDIPWGTQQPNRIGGGSTDVNCGALWSGDERAADYECSQNKYFVCEARSTCAPLTQSPTLPSEYEEIIAEYEQEYDVDLGDLEYEDLLEMDNFDEIKEELDDILFP